MRHRMEIAHTDDGGFLLTFHGARGTATTAVERTVEHAMDRVYEHFSGRGAAAARKKAAGAAREKLEAAQAAARTPNVKLGGPVSR